MLERLQLTDVGPAPRMELELTPRINFLTGDNGLGKSFLLDIAWWALTRTWSHAPAAPQRREGATPTIAFRYGARTKTHDTTIGFDRDLQDWPIAPGRPPIPGLVIYAQVDGGFAAWDPARNVWKSSEAAAPGYPRSFRFAPDEVWDGLPRDEPRKLCNGLIHDWAAWQRENGAAFAQLTRVLQRLSPAPDEQLEPGALTRIAVDDVRDHPTIQMPYGQDVPLVHASAGIRRIAALAYLLVWTWQEHERAAELRGQNPAREIIFLIDEIEAHLHPQWQRRIVPALLDVMDALTGTHDVDVQLVVATHSPLVLAATEPHFDDTKDSLWELDLVNGQQVELRRGVWRRHVDVNAWLDSPTFDHTAPLSIEAEEALADARELLRRNVTPTPAEVDRVDARLRQVLDGMDKFFVRWSAFVDRVHGRAA